MLAIAELRSKKRNCAVIQNPKSKIQNRHLSRECQSGLGRVAAGEAEVELVVGVERYLADAAETLRPRSLAETARGLRMHWKPYHDVSVFDLKRRAVADHLDKLKRDRGPAAA